MDFDLLSYDNISEVYISPVHGSRRATMTIVSRRGDRHSFMIQDINSQLYAVSLLASIMRAVTRL